MDHVRPVPDGAPQGDSIDGIGDELEPEPTPSEPAPSEPEPTAPAEDDSYESLPGILD